MNSVLKRTTNKLRSIELLLVLMLAGCSADPPPAVAPEPFSNEAEVLFQTEEVLRYSLDEFEREEQLRRELLGPDSSQPDNQE